jgi:hypothetical protein
LRRHDLAIEIITFEDIGKHGFYPSNQAWHLRN